MEWWSHEMTAERRFRNCGCRTLQVWWGHLCLFLFLIVCHPASAEMLFPKYLRAAAASSDTIVIVRPVAGSSLSDRQSQDWKHQTSFDVEEVLKGDPKLASTSLRVLDRSLFALSSPWQRGETSKLKQAMLFLTKAREGDWNLDYLYGLTADNVVVRPTQMINPGPYVLAEKPDLSWSEAKEIVLRFLPEIAALNTLRTIPEPSKRNQALFGWINDHKNEFYGPFLNAKDRTAEPRTGWGRFEHEVFGWILESGIHSDSWLALQKHSETCTYPITSWANLDHNNTFTNHSGRSFLLSKLIVPSESIMARRSAARLLADSLNNGPLDSPNPERNSVTPADQAAILKAAIPLAKHDDKVLRREVIYLLLSATDPFNDASRPQKNTEALPVITNALKLEQDNEMLSDIPSRLNHLMDELEWKALTGNAARIRVTVSASMNAGQLHLQVNSDHLPDGAELPVEVTLVRLDANGKETEAVTRKVAAHYPKKWPKDWQGVMSLDLIPVESLPSGTWKVYLKGITADERKLPWTSWHTCFRAP